MKKFGIILTLIIIVISSIFAQATALPVPNKSKKINIQFEAGINNFRFYDHFLWNFCDVSQSHYESISIEKELNNFFSISCGLRNTNYGIQMSNLALSDNNGNIIAKNIVANFNYWTIQTPIQIKIKPFPSKKLSIHFGGYLGFNYFNSASSSNSKLLTYPDKYKNQIDKGYIIGCDYQWYKRKNFILGNSISFYNGLNNIAPTVNHIPRKAQGLTIGFIGTLGF